MLTPNDLEERVNPQAQISLAALFIISMVILVVVTVAAILFLGYTQPEKDHTTTITLLLGLLTPILAGLMVLISKQNDIANEASKERRAARLQLALAQQQIAQVGHQVAAVAERTESIEAKSDEAVVTSRAGIAAMVKAKGAIEFDLLTDKFVKGSLTLGETERLSILAVLREKDDLTDVQREQLIRMQEILKTELTKPGLAEKPFVVVTRTETKEAKAIQAILEIAQIQTGARKENPEEEAPKDKP